MTHPSSSLPGGLDWPGAVNARDLAGTPIDGGVIAAGALFRSGWPGAIGALGWQRARAVGVRTVLDLRSARERASMPGGAPAPIVTTAFALNSADAALWRDLDGRQISGTPLYFDEFVVAKPHFCVIALRRIVDARPGGVLFHCAAGRDRTGLLALLLLSVLGADPDRALADYWASAPALRNSPQVHKQQAIDERCDRLDAHSHRPALLDQHWTVRQLKRGGLRRDDLHALRGRLLEPR